MLPQGELAGLVALGWPSWADLAGGSCLDWLGWLARWLADWASLVAGLAELAQLAAQTGSGSAGCMCFMYLHVHVKAYILHIHNMQLEWRLAFAFEYHIG